MIKNNLITRKSIISENFHRLNEIKEALKLYKRRNKENRLVAGFKLEMMARQKLHDKNSQIDEKLINEILDLNEAVKFKNNCLTDLNIKVDKNEHK